MVLGSIIIYKSFVYYVEYLIDAYLFNVIVHKIITDHWKK